MLWIHKAILAFFPFKGSVIYLPYSKKGSVISSDDSCLEFTVHLSLRIPFQSFTERYELLRKSWSKKRVWDKSNSHPAEKKGEFLQVIPLPSREIVTAAIWYHTDQIITVFITILKILP